MGFEKSGTRMVLRGNISVSLRIGNWTHWYVTTPYGKKDYRSQRQALHALVGYCLITHEDLKLMAASGYEPAKMELDRYLHTLESYSKRLISEMGNQTEYR